MDDKCRLIISALGKERVKKDEKLSYHTFSKIGGPAQLFYIATLQKDLTQALDVCFELKFPFFVLGSGTKVLVPNRGIKGLVIKNRTSVIKVGGIKGKVGRDGIGIEEALVEIDSGVCIGKINEFLGLQKMRKLESTSSGYSSLGGSLFLDPLLKSVTQKIKVWENGETTEVLPDQLKRINSVVLSAVLKAYAL